MLLRKKNKKEIRVYLTNAQRKTLTTSSKTAEKMLDLRRHHSTQEAHNLEKNISDKFLLQKKKKINISVNYEQILQ